MKNLKLYIERRNLMSSFFDHPLLDANNLTAEQKAQVESDLECELSPENLSCDGELRGEPLRRKAALLNAALKELRSL